MLRWRHAHVQVQQLPVWWIARLPRVQVPHPAIRLHARAHAADVLAIDRDEFARQGRQLREGEAAQWSAAC